MSVQGIIGKKLGMTQVYAEDGRAVPVTIVQAGPCVVVQRKTEQRDGYSAAQLGLVEERRVRHVTKAMKGHFDKAGLPPCRVLRELQVAGDDAVKVGDRISVDIFAPGDTVDIVGVSKGKGFQGVVKRHHFAGGDATHGSMFHRAPGGIGDGPGGGAENTANQFCGTGQGIGRCTGLRIVGHVCSWKCVWRCVRNIADCAPRPCYRNRVCVKRQPWITVALRACTKARS